MNQNSNFNGFRNNQSQIDLGNIYGINSEDESNDRDSSYLTLGYPIPSLEQIAAYNSQFLPQPTQQPAVLTQPAVLNQPAPGTESEFTPSPSQMYSPITQQAAEETPTPANTIGVEYIAPSQGESGLINAITDYSNPYPVTQESIQFLNGFIRTQIGRRVSIDFLVGSNSIVTKNGFLLGVATNYILINELNTDDITACDFYNIKFIRFYY